MKHYMYIGPVMEFNYIVTDSWKGNTFASSESKAKSNLAYQYKKLTGRTNDTKISLPGKLQIISH